MDGKDPLIDSNEAISELSELLRRLPYTAPKSIQKGQIKLYNMLCGLVTIGVFTPSDKSNNETLYIYCVSKKDHRRFEAVFGSAFKGYKLEYRVTGVPSPA